MHERIWGDLDHRLSVIVRWGTTQSIHKQTVAEHIFNVERMACRIAKQWFGITDMARLFQIMRWAHHHEDLEALSGDIPTMSKPYLDEEAMAKEHADLIPVRHPHDEEVRNIVKLADMLDCFWWLHVERKMGNAYLEEHWVFEANRITSYAHDKWGYEIYQKTCQLLDSMRQEISIRHSRRGR
jgi:5'-deoxynucleotidase YfbR-like HD superfamily hydrolase